MSEEEIQREPLRQRKTRGPNKPKSRTLDRAGAYYDLAAADESIHGADYGYGYGQRKNLPMPEARHGFVQRWVRIGIAGKPDFKNRRDKADRGYMPRPPGSVKGMPVSKMGDDEVIGDENNVLMERPAWMEKKEIAARNEMSKNQMREVHRNVFNDGKAAGGFGGIQYAEDKTKATTGRPAPVDDDPIFS